MNKQNVAMNDLKMKEINCQSELIDLLPKWQKLSKICANYNLFSDPLWITSWLSTYWQKNWHLKVLTIRYKEELIAIIPLYYQFDNVFFTVKKLYPLGQGEPENQEISSEYLDILIHPELKSEVYPFIVQWISNLKFDFFNWKALVVESLGTKLLEKAPYHLEITEATRYIVHNKYWLFSNLSKNMRSRYRRGLNQLDKLNGEMIWVKQSDFDLYWTKMKLFHQHRWQEKNKKGAFCSDEFNKFHTKFRNKSPKNVAMSAILINNSPIAIHYYFSDATTLYFYQSGWDEAEYSHLSPGMLLHLWSIKNNHKTYYDFMMGKKHDSYKAKFGTIQEPMYNITITSSPIKLLIQRILKKMKLYRL